MSSYFLLGNVNNQKDKSLAENDHFVQKGRTG